MFLKEIGSFEFPPGGAARRKLQKKKVGLSLFCFRKMQKYDLSVSASASFRPGFSQICVIDDVFMVLLYNVAVTSGCAVLLQM